MSNRFEDEERRSPEERRAAFLTSLNAQLARAAALPGYAGALPSEPLETLDDLSGIPFLRKSDLMALQAKAPPFGGLTTRMTGDFDTLHQSPGPIYEPGMNGNDWWRLGRFFHAAGIGAGDVVQNCFGYHLTPAGHMMESGAEAVDATVIPAGTGQTELQVQSAAAFGATAYAGTPDYLKTILEKADEMAVPLHFRAAVVSGGALFPALREFYSARGISCLQCYATADLGLIAYESPAMEGMIVDEDVLVEIVTPGTGTPVPEGDVGEVVVTTLNPDYPLIRFATGDLSAVLPGPSPCGRTNLRIKGWMGRADQTTKIKGMFVRPEQVAALVDRFEDVERARVVASRIDDRDRMVVQVEGASVDVPTVEAAVRDVLKLAGEVEVVAPGDLPRDGVVIEDTRSYD